MLREVRREVVDRVPVGAYLVTFERLWGSHCNDGPHDDCVKHGCMDNEPDFISDINAEIVKVTRSNYLDLPEVVTGREVDWNTGAVNGDEHDIRPRLFKTLKEAKSHAENTTQLFRNPEPWRVFVRTA